MRAILFENDDDIAALLPAVCVRAGITLKSVSSKEELIHELRFLHSGYFLLIDLTHEDFPVIEVVNGIMVRETIDIYIIARNAALIERLETQTGLSLHWIPADLSLRSLLKEFRYRLVNTTQEYAEQSYTPLLSEQERRVVFYLTQDLTNKQIAAHLKIQEGTVKTYISRICRKCRLPDRKAISRQFQQEMITLSMVPGHSERTKLTKGRTYNR